MDNRWNFDDPHLQDFVREVCNQLEAIQSGEIQNISVILNIDNGFYFGPKDSDGTWRIIRVGANIELQVRTSGAWVYQGRWTP